MKTNGRRKVLRIGVLESGRIIEERLVRQRRAVTVGRSARDTQMVPDGEMTPARSLRVFDQRNGRWWLRCPDGTEVRLSGEGGVEDLESLRRTGIAVRRGAVWRVPLSERSRGRLQIGDLTLLFQFVTPPPRAAKVTLPAAVRGSWARRIDWPLVMILLLSTFLQGGAVGSLVVQDWPDTPTRRGTIPDQFVRLFPPPAPAVEKPKPPPEAGPAAAAEPAKKPAERKPADKQAPATEAEAEASARDRAQRKARLAATVREKTLIKVLTAKGGSGLGVFQDSLRLGAGRTNIDRAFAAAGGVTHASALTERSHRGPRPGAGSAVGIGTLKGGVPAGPTPSGPKRKTELRAPKLKTGPIAASTGSGRLPKGAIAAVVRSRLRSVQSCYERALKQQPDLGGKLTVEFTVGTTGRVTSLATVHDGLGSGMVRRCVERRVGRWTFPKPDGGDVTVRFPFVFTAAR